MILEAARAAVSRLFSAEFRSGLLQDARPDAARAGRLWFGLKELFDWLALPWIDAAAARLPELGRLARPGRRDPRRHRPGARRLRCLIAPVTAIVAGLFLDDVAEVVEHNDYPRDPPGRPVPAIPGDRCCR